MASQEPEKSPYSINVLILDNQHQVLFETMRRLKEVMKLGEGARELPKLLRELARLVSYHFPTEERLMESYGYPLRDMHALEHQTGCKHLRKMNRLIRIGDNSVAVQAMDLLNYWLEHHVGHWDARLGEYLNAHGVS
ncbi:MAG TPA: hemerythrin family protein [Bryobacteraceae bacterium]|nr:hemerythrin family protein [Bryobacteraceae bacterium]